MPNAARLVVVVLLALCCAWSAAAVAPVYQWSGAFGWMGTSKTGASTAEVCQALLPDFIAQYGTQYGFSGHRTSLDDSSSSSATCGGYATRDGSESRYAGASISRGGSTSCPTNSSLVGGQCLCSSGFVENSDSTACVAPPNKCQTLAGTAGGSLEWAGQGSSSCLDGCTVAAAGGGGSVSFRIGGVWRTGAEQTTYTGGSCTAAPADSAAPDPCPNGDLGTVSGRQVCVPRDSSVPQQQQTQTSSTNASGQTTTTTQVTSCTNGSCNTTTTTNVSGGGGAGSSSTSSDTKPISLYCSDPANKATPICRNTNSGTASTGTIEQTQDSLCAKNPSASGCGGQPPTSSASDLYAKKDKTIKSVLTDAKDGLMSSPLGSGIVGFFNVGSGGGCPASTWTIPFLNATVTADTWCSALAANMFAVIRVVLLVVAGFMAFRIAIDN